MNNKVKSKIIFGALLCIGVLTVAGISYSNDSKMTSEIPEHDGEVLVDSINIQSKDPLDNKDTQAQSKDNTKLVSSDDIGEIEHEDSYFKEMRATVTLDRNQVIAMLTDAETTAETSAEKENATAQKQKILDNMQKEIDIENKIRAKGLPECFVLISENGINVTVDKQELNDTDVAKICDIIMRETGVGISEIVVQSRF